MKPIEISQRTLEDAIKDIPFVNNKAISNTPKITEDTIKEFHKISSNFWKYYESGKYKTTYDSGSIRGTYGSNRTDITTIFSQFLTAIKESLEHLASEDDTELSEFKPFFDNLLLAEELLNEKIKSFFKKDVDGLRLISYIHGSLNAHINKNIKETE